MEKLFVSQIDCVAYLDCHLLFFDDKYNLEKISTFLYSL